MMSQGKTIDDLDFNSQMILEVLLNRGGSATASELKESLGLAQTGQIHYRVSNDIAQPDLSQMGLVRDTGEMEMYNGNSSKVYELTEEGEDEALRQNLDLAPELHRGQLEREIDQLLDNLSATLEYAKASNNRAVKAHERIDEAKSTVDGWSGEMESLRSDIERVDNRLDNLNSLISDDVDREQEIKDVASEVASLREEVEEIQEEMESMREFRASWANWAQSVSNRLDTLEAEGEADEDEEGSSGWFKR